MDRRIFNATGVTLFPPPAAAPTDEDGTAPAAFEVEPAAILGEGFALFVVAVDAPPPARLALGAESKQRITELKPPVPRTTSTR